MSLTKITYIYINSAELKLHLMTPGLNRQFKYIFSINDLDPWVVWQSKYIFSIYNLSTDQSFYETP